MTEILGIVPDAVWGAGLGSAITLFGVWLTNRHERKLKAEDRLHATRKEIFLGAADELLLAKVLIAKLPAMNPSNVQEEMDLGLSIGKIQIIGNDETMRAATRMHSFFTEKLFELMPKMLPLQNLREVIANESKLIENDALAQKQVLERMTNYNLEGNKDNEYFERLQSNFDFHAKQVNEHIEFRDEKYKELAEKEFELSRLTSDAIIQMSEIEIDTISCIRAELDIPFDAEEYRKLVITKNAHMKEKLDELLSKVESER